MGDLKRLIAAAIVCAGAVIWSGGAWADDCARFSSGSEVLPPPDLFSSNGALTVDLHYKTVKTLTSLNLCFQTPDGLESPTLNVLPGDVVTVNLTDDLPSGGPSERISNSTNVCGSSTMDVSSVNIHFHGLNVSPRCHGDEVVRTLVNSGQTFTYKIQIPANEPPGLYWYHPHVHGISSAAVQGGASGVIIVGGIENLQPAVAGLPQRLLVVRDQLLPGGDPQKWIATAGRHHASSKKPDDPPPQPSWDVSVNYVPVLYPDYQPSIIEMTAGTREFWRLANASANTILDLELIYDGKPQVMQIVALDGVPAGSQDGKAQGFTIPAKHILVPPAGRVEFIMNGPAAKIANAQLVTRAIDGGPDSDSNPARPLAQIQLTGAPQHLARMPQRSGPPHKQRFADLEHARVTATRTLYFSEHPVAGKGPDTPMDFFITVDGQTETLFDPNNPPAIVTNRGAVEDWTIENHTQEVHEFHMHQIHFLLLAVNGKRVPWQKRQFYDTLQVPYWTGSGPYPSVTVRMDFRGAIAGDFVYHCHILEHEDGGMMAIIRVRPTKA